MRISDWSSDVCSSDLAGGDNDVLRLNIRCLTVLGDTELAFARQLTVAKIDSDLVLLHQARDALVELLCNTARTLNDLIKIEGRLFHRQAVFFGLLHIMIYFARAKQRLRRDAPPRSEEHTSELQSLMRISYASFSLKTKNIHI